MTGLVQLFSCCYGANNKKEPQNFESALRAQNVDSLRKIIEDNSFNPNVPLQNGALPLHLAVHAHASQDVLDLLLKKGAKPFLEDNAGLTALDHAMLVGGQKRTLSLLQNVVPLDEATMKEVIQEKEKIGLLIQAAREALKTAVNLVMGANGATLSIVQQLYAGKLEEQVHKKEYSKQDKYGFLPLHHAIGLLSRATPESAPFLQESITKLFGKTGAITAQTTSHLSVAHYAVLAKCQHALDEVAKHPKKSELLLSKTLTGLTPLHIALLNKDFEQATFLYAAEPKALIEPDDHGLKPIDILLHAVLTHADDAEANSGPIEKRERTLLAMQILFPLAEAGYAAYLQQIPCPSDSGLLRFIPTLFMSMLFNRESTHNFLNCILYSTENAQRQEPTSAIVQGTIEGAIKPQGVYGLLFKLPRIYRVGQSSLSSLKKSWHYASYEPLTSLKNGIVHIATSAITAGRTAYSLFMP